MDPLERISVGEVMSKNVVSVGASASVKELMEKYFFSGQGPKHQSYPVLDKRGHLVGIVSRSNLLTRWISELGENGMNGAHAVVEPIVAYDLIEREPITIFPWEACRAAAERMAQAQVGRLLVVSPDDPQKLVGIVTRSDLLKPRELAFEEEGKREKFFDARLLRLDSKIGEGI